MKPARSISDARITFVSPQVDTDTQTVLAKASIENPRGQLRVAQQVRAQVVWSKHEGPVIPVLSVSRINGRFFAFVAVKEANGTFARQKGLTLGDIIGNDYVVLDGMKPGDHLIVSGTQFFQDGMPVIEQVQAPMPSLPRKLPPGELRTSAAIADDLRLKSSGRRTLPLFVDFFIRRPVFATVCALMIILGGAISIPSLPVAQFPDLAPPQVVVSSGYIGANAQTVESAVTIPLEQSINGVQGMKYITSTSGNDGTSQVTVTFDVSRNVDLASVDVQNRVNQALGRLAQRSQKYRRHHHQADSADSFSARAFIPRTAQYDSLFLSNYLDIYVKDAVKRVPGVGDVFIFGERKYAMRLWLDPGRMAQRGLSATNVLNALQEQNVQVAAGQVGEAALACRPSLSDQRPRHRPPDRSFANSTTSF